MKRVGVREFRDHATQYLAGDDVLAIERHGQPIGFYVPTAAKHPESWARALERLQKAVELVLAETGLGEEELSRLYDLREPLPEQPRRRARSRAAASDAPGR